VETVEARVAIRPTDVPIVFGSEDHMDDTVIGGEVNLAARLEAHADSGGILTAAETYSLVNEWLAAEEREAITINGNRANKARTKEALKLDLALLDA